MGLARVVNFCTSGKCRIPGYFNSGSHRKAFRLSRIIAVAVWIPCIVHHAPCFAYTSTLADYPPQNRSVGRGSVIRGSVFLTPAMLAYTDGSGGEYSSDTRIRSCGYSWIQVPEEWMIAAFPHNEDLTEKDCSFPSHSQRLPV